MWVVLKIRVPLLGTLNNRCCIIIGTEKGTIILTTTHVYIYIYICMYFYTHLYTYVYVNIHIHLEELCIQSFVVGAYISLQPSQPGVSHRLCVLPCPVELVPSLGAVAAHAARLQTDALHTLESLSQDGQDLYVANMKY